MKKVVWRYEGSSVAEPATRDADPWCKLIGAITNATTYGAPIVTLEKAET